MPRNKLRDKFDTEEAYKAYMAELDRLGGKAKVPKGRYHGVKQKRQKAKS